jgi:hypothetical protein
MTLDLYGHLLPDRLDDVAERMDLMARAADGWNATSAPVVSLLL